MRSGARGCSGSRYRRVATLISVGLVACPAAYSPDSPGSTPSLESEVPAFSLLATGDTGKRHRLVASLLEGQIAVAEGMAIEDERQPVDTLVLLGDNFYDQGLQQEELVPRIRENIVRPYCRFLASDGPRWREVRDACPISEGERHAIPLYAILGNHDISTPESPELQRSVLPEFVSNWTLDTGLGHVVEFPQGVSLILLNSEIHPYGDRSRSLAALLRQSRGRWRIVASHRPPTVDDQGGDAISGLRESLEKASAQAEMPLHVVLSGHRHSLQLLTSSAPDPILSVIVGSGARHRPIRTPHPDRVFGLASLGFARVDLFGSGEDERLVVTLFATPDFPVLGTEPERVASWSVDLRGRTRDEF